MTGAVLFDLQVGDENAKPNAKMGYMAAKLANQNIIKEGNAGAGMGASVAKTAGIKSAIKGGLGQYSIKLKCGVIVTAIIAVNAWGNIIKGDQLIATTRHHYSDSPTSAIESIINTGFAHGDIGQNTTIGAIITNASINKPQALKIAQMGHDGFARAINPVHSTFDGDTLFCAATNEIYFTDTNTLGIMATEASQQAIYRAIEKAKPAGGLPTTIAVN